MPDIPPLFVTVDWGVSVTTVTVHGELDNHTSLKLRERITWAIESRPQRLVLDLAGVTDRFGDFVIPLLAAARQQLPPGCPLEVRSVSPVVRSLLEINGWPGVRVGAAAEPGDAGPA